MSLSKSFKKDNVKNIAKSESDFNYDTNYKFYRFCKQYHEFEEISLDSNYNRINEFNKGLDKFKALKPIQPEMQLKKGRIMKNVDELYEKYYNDYKNDFDNDDVLSKAKNKKFDYKQFELFDKTDKKLKLDKETEDFFKVIRDRVVDKKKFMEYFSYETATLVNDLLSQNTQDFKKRLDEIKQQKIKLKEVERNMQIIKMKMTSLIIYLVLLTEFINFLSINFCQINNQHN